MEIIPTHVASLNLEPLVVGGNVETVEDGPVQVDACIESLVKHSVVLGCLSGGSGFGLGIVYGSLVAGGEVQCGQVARIAQCGVVLADLLFIADNAQGVVVQVFEQIVKSCRGEVAQPGFSESNSCIPVYYAEEKNKPRYLSPAFLERNCYQKTLEAILKENGGFQP